MARTKGQKSDGRSSDLTFGWMLTTFGPHWKVWQEFAEEWMAEQSSGVADKREALTSFFNYLRDRAPYAVNVGLFFLGHNGHICSTNELEAYARNTVTSPGKVQKRMNYPVDFIDFVIERAFSEENDNGILHLLVQNPLSKIKIPRKSTETVRTPLPYRYIKDLRQILCPLPNREEMVEFEEGLADNEALKPSCHYRHFRDWKWAQEQTGYGTGRDGDWFEVDEALIDDDDPDCVWRSKTVMRNNKRITIHQIWSPVRSMVIFVKLHLPLRTYQVRMLDSGEADTWRYEQGRWIANGEHNFALGSEKRPFAKGVFRRILDNDTESYKTGLYINTNKTADQNKDELDRGYVIPWENEEVLYWLEKLRNWQEKYNPISEPTDCVTLKKKHTGQVKSKAQLAAMGEICFLFRDAAAKGDDRTKPIHNTALDNYWFKLLLQLENQLAVRGDVLNNGDRLKLVQDYEEGAPKNSMVSTLFPLHSLRVSLITAYVLDTPLPLPVVSKLLAGHTRLLMTIYYTKITPSVMVERMVEADDALNENEGQSVRNFLKDASLSQIQCKAAYHDEDSIMAALANRTPIGWEMRAHGLCLVGGNSIKSDEVSTLGGCWNGGELMKDATVAANRVYANVPHGPENCVRCRWFITDATHLPALTAYLNQFSYRASEAANQAIEIEQDLDDLKDEMFLCGQEGRPFARHEELQALERRHEKQMVEADEYVKDLQACFKLIARIISAESQRDENDTKDKIVAAGQETDLSQALRFVETDSELLQLSVLCEDAEFLPDCEDSLRKTPAIEKRNRHVMTALLKKGMYPPYLEMDDRMRMITINALMRELAKQADPEDQLEGFRKVCGYIEAGQYMEDNKLVDTVRELSNSNMSDQNVINMKSLTQLRLTEAS
jgi:hypothetical protein